MSNKQNDIWEESQKEFKDEKLYIIFDERAILQGTDKATCMVTCDSLEEAREYKGEYGKRCPVYSYDIKRGDRLINEKFIEII